MGGSSGGSSGAVSYPAYMETMHSTWLTAIAADIVTATTGASPYATATAYDPDCVLNATNYIISLFYDEVLAMSPATDWSTYYDAAEAKYTPATIAAITSYTFDDILTDAAITALVAAYTTRATTRRDTLKASYKVGMSNIGAVVSSSFTLGDALLTAEVAMEIAEFEAKLVFENEERKLRYQLGQADENSAHNANIIKRDAVIVNYDTANRAFNENVAAAIMSNDIQHLGLYQALSHLTTEANRIKIVAKGEENQRNLDFDRQDAVWDLEMYQYGSNVLAGIAGGSASTGKEVSTASSVLGGALSGAAAGAQIGTIGGLPGAAVGAAIGGLAGLFS